MKLIPATSFWERPDEGETPLLGVSEEQIKAWEKRHKLTFPDVLRGPYEQQNGGLILHGDVYLSPLEEITWIESDIWAMIVAVEPALEDQTRAVELAGEDDRLAVLYYDVAGPLMVYRFSFYTDVVAEDPLTFEEFIRQQHHATPEPAFSWDETTQGHVLFHERVPGFGGDPEDFSEFAVIKTDQHVLIYERASDTQTRTRLTLPLALEECYIDRQSWRGTRTYELSITGEMTEDDTMSCTQCSDGMWKVETDNGGGMVSIESTNRAKLEELINALMGPDAVRRLRRRNRRERLGTIFFSFFMLAVVVPLILLFLIFSITMRILTWPIRLFMRRRSGPPPAPPGTGPIVIVKPE